MTGARKDTAARGPGHSWGAKRRRGWGLPSWTPGDRSPGASPCRGEGETRVDRSRPRPSWAPLSHAPVSWLPSPFLFSRSGCSSDYHHHCLPHHGHSCSDYNSCLKKLVRLLGPSGLDMGAVGVPREVCTEGFLLFRPGPTLHPRALFFSFGPENWVQLLALL